MERLYRVREEKIREKDTRKRAWIEEQAKSVGDELRKKRLNMLEKIIRSVWENVNMRRICECRKMRLREETKSGSKLR